MACIDSLSNINSMRRTCLPAVLWVGQDARPTNVVCFATPNQKGLDKWEQIMLLLWQIKDCSL